MRLLRFFLFTFSFFLLPEGKVGSFAADLPANTAVFVVNQGQQSAGVLDSLSQMIGGTKVEGEGEERRVTIPVLQSDGTYQDQVITTSTENGVRQITVENQDGVHVVNNVDDYVLRLSAAQVAVSENIECSPTGGTCVIRPFMMVIGSRVLSADEFTVGYTEGEDLVIAGGDAKNLRLTGEKSQTVAGDSMVSVTFAGKGFDTKDPVATSDALLNLPQTFSEQDYFRLDLGSSKLTHSVKDPKTGEFKDQWGVKDGGVRTSLIVDNRENLNVHFHGQTDGGFFYDSDPFSDRSVKVDTTAPITTDLVMVDRPEGTMTTLSIAMANTDKDGSPATATIVDSRSSEREDRIDASGGAFINLSSTVAWNDGNPSYRDEPVAFEVGADDMTVTNTFAAGQSNVTNVSGLRAAGNVTPGSTNKEVVATGTGLSHAQLDKDGRPVLSAGVDSGFSAYIYEDDSSRIVEGMATHAYYNNGGTVVDLSGGVAVRVTDYKDQGEDSKFNGRPVERDAVIIGHNATLNYGGSAATVKDGFAARQITFADNGSKLTLIEGEGGKLTDQQYGVEMSDGYRVSAYQDDKGKLKAAEVTTGIVSADNYQDGSHLGLVSSNTTLDISKDSQTEVETIFITHKSEGVTFTDGKGDFVAGADKIQGQAVIAEDIKYGSGKFDGVEISGKKDEQTGKTPKLTFMSVEAAVYMDETEPNNRTVEALFGIEGLNATHADYTFNVVAVDELGNEGRFQIYYLENEDGRKIAIYGEDGKLVNLSAEDAKEGTFYNVLLEAAQYIETDDFRSILATKVSGQMKPIDASDSRLTTFNLARVEGMEKLDGSYRHFILKEGHIRTMDGSDEYGVGFARASFVETNSFDTSTLIASAENGYFDFVKYAGGAKAVNGNAPIAQSANLTFGNAIYARMEVEGQKPITVFQGQDINVVAVDYEKMLELNGRIGEVNFFEDSRITAVEAKDLENFRAEDHDNKISALLNADRVVRVIQRDDSGKETGSYLLIDSAFLEAKDHKNGINANIRVGVLEYFKDELSGRDLFLNVDVSGKVNVTNSNLPFDMEANFSAKANNVTTSSTSYVSDDGATVTQHFSIKAFNEQGSIDHISLSAGPSFLKDAVSFKAKGGPEGGKELSFTFHQDKRSGMYYIRAEFKEGESVKMKLFPFTLESKQVGNDAIADLLISPKGQNYMNHLQIITSVVDTHQITSWLEISESGMLIASTPALGGVGIEIMYQDTDKFYVPGDPSSRIDGAAATLGAGIYIDGDSGARTSLGLMLSGDSEIGYHTNGTFKVFGFDLGKEGRIPATINLYAKREFADGDALYGGLSYDLTSALVDENYLDPKGAYFEGGGRAPGSFGAAISYKKKLGERSSITFSVGANQDLTSPAACVTFKTSTDEVGNLIGNGIRAIRRMGFN